ncbi:MAG: thiamine-phosphate kinase [Myxococcales bacterium]|nr:thiamine-phosphate kinase [Myxococcales bacterium]
MTTVSELGERALLEALLDLWRPDLDEEVVLGPGDDAAVVDLPGRAVMTVDSIVAGQDWLVDQTPPQAIGHRAAAVNLSDLAAMGASPRHLLVALDLNSNDDADDLLEAALGLAQTCRQFGARVIGGDIGIGSGPQRWTVTAVGVQTDELLTRSAAQPGHRIWLVGEVGQAALGLHALLHGREDPLLQPCIKAHLWPTPQVAAGQLLAQLSGPIAAMDVSDGLWLDAARMAEASGCALRIQLPRPNWMSPDREALCTELGWNWRDGCAAGGDDYALLITAPWDVDVTATLGGIAPATPIGIVEVGQGVQMDVDSHRLAGQPQGYLHGN